MNCRFDCGACCIAISISSSIPGMPNGKPAGVRCIHLTDGNLCSLFNDPSRPSVCGSFPAMEDICGSSRDEALGRISEMERKTQ